MICDCGGRNAFVMSIEGATHLGKHEYSSFFHEQMQFKSKNLQFIHSISLTYVDNSSSTPIIAHTNRQM